MPSSTRQQHEQVPSTERSAYRATSHRLSTGSTSSLSARHLSGIPSISTTADTNKPLPPSPTESERKRRKPNYLRSILGGPSSSHLDPSHLQPQPYSHNHTYSRSMPSSPYDYNQSASSPQPSTSPRTHSTASNYLDLTQYEPYTPPLHQQSDSANSVRSQRATSMNTYFEITPPRARTFPTDTSVTSPNMREGVSSRPRPHTWLSPTDSFSDASQFSLFVQATTGLPEDSGTFSPTGPPQLQGSLFARRSHNDIIPIPLQNASAAAPRTTHSMTDWQNFDPPAFTSHALSAQNPGLQQSPRFQHFQESPHVAAVNRELEMLGIEDENAPDDELPDYQQSQAEAHRRQRAEASARARELEARWRSTRGR
ncbi:hypothetical protein CC86DRAFT_293211 [Ophiobolus disseminans]|uniref:Uncharacterized protein n=1 Tax=Ophiobolus disseminans TaxID=1469910 RepID=A0A6A7A051_9PLEO|nr:hypothetical protein CC86DRAFT_293211 [Ophiobolus disseminans]